jgi:hypothetical protein
MPVDAPQNGHFTAVCGNVFHSYGVGHMPTRQIPRKTQLQQDASPEKQVQANRQRIEGNIDTVQPCGLSATFSQGLKKNQLQQPSDHRDGLMSGPQACLGGQSVGPLP